VCTGAPRALYPHAPHGIDETCSDASAAATPRALSGCIRSAHADAAQPCSAVAWITSYLRAAATALLRV
jgi:hypothetical protein